MNEIDRPEEFEKLSGLVTERLLAWIKARFGPGRRDAGSTSYGMKHWFEVEEGVYVTNGAFKGAMVAAGWRPLNEEEKNWRFPCRWRRACEAKTMGGSDCRQRALPGVRICRTHYYLVGRIP